MELILRIYKDNDDNLYYIECDDLQIVATSAKLSDIYSKFRTELKRVKNTYPTVADCLLSDRGIALKEKFSDYGIAGLI
jgi:hypothetical protein